MESKMEVFEFTGENFKVVMSFESWRIGMLRYGSGVVEHKRFERHMLTDEAFILMDGEATLYTHDGETRMEKCKIYNMPKGTWHDCTLKEGAAVMVVENIDTGKENTEYEYL